MATGTGTKDDPWVLKTPPGTSEYTMYRDDASDPPTIVCQVGGTKLLYDARAIDDLHAMLKAHGDWMPLGGADEQKPAPMERSRPGAAPMANPRGGWYGLKKGPARPVRRVHAAAARGARPGRGHPRRQEQQDAGDRMKSFEPDRRQPGSGTGGPVVPWRCRRRPVRCSRRSESPCHRRAAGRARAFRQEDRGRAADQSAGRLAPSAPAEARGPGRREARGTRRIYQLHDQGVEAVQAYVERVWGEAAAISARRHEPEGSERREP